MIERILDLKELILDGSLVQREEWITDASYWSNLVRALSVLTPLLKCIAVAEGETSTVGETVKPLLEFARTLFCSDWSEPLTVEGVSSFLKYFGPKKVGREEFTLLLSTYVLDRRNKSDIITEEGLDLAFEAILDAAKKNECSFQAINEALGQEYANYCNQEGMFSKKQPLTQFSYDWWCSMCGWSILKPLAMRLSRLTLSSGNIEKTFSTLKWFQGSRRGNLGV